MPHDADPPRPPAWTATIWPLVTGLAVGFLVGRETVGHGSGGGATADVAADKSSDTVPAGTKMPAKIYSAESEFPAGWTKEADLSAVTSVSFAGLTPQQKVTALQALNERDCECGCGMGKIAGCLKKDPNCPRSPNLARLAIDMAKQGKGLGAILAAIDDQQKTNVPSPGAAPAAGGSKKVVPFSHDLRRGAKATKVTIVEFSDFQCPFCKRAEPTVRGVLDKYGKDVALVWMNQPLPFHEHAMDAATAFQAAARQGADKAWKLHDKMYENNTALTRPDIEKYAGEVGLNLGKLKQDWDDAKIKADIAEDMKIGTQVGANGTPTFYINGHELVGAQEAAAFEKIVDDEIKAADALIKKGTPLRDVYAKRIELAALAAPAPSPGAPAAPPEPEGKFDVRLGDAPVKGPATAPVTLIAFSDFQCPFCSRAVPTVRQLESDYQGKLRIAFKQFPLPFHDHAHLAAEAALAANEQGKFWQYHDKLFANQQALERPALETYAQELGLDMAKFRAALDSGKFKDKVDAEAKEGAAVGTTGTPTFFINGTRLVGAQPLDAFKAVIDKELKTKG
jgi:protein-disulfide isomerase